MPRWVKKVIDYMEWKERCVLKFCDPDQTDAAKAKFMRDAMVPLMDNGFIERGGTKDKPYVWLTDMGRK